MFIFFRRCRWHRWQTFIREYLREFSKKFEKIPMRYSEARGTLIYEKNLKSKISCQTPFKPAKENKKTKTGLVFQWGCALCTVCSSLQFSPFSWVDICWLVGRYLLLPSPLRVPSSFLLLILSMFITMASVRGTGLKEKMQNVRKNCHEGLEWCVAKLLARLSAARCVPFSF